MKNILKRLIVLSEYMIEEEVVKCLLSSSTANVDGKLLLCNISLFVPQVSMKSTLVKVLVLGTGCSL